MTQPPRLRLPRRSVVPAAGMPADTTARPSPQRHHFSRDKLPPTPPFGHGRRSRVVNAEVQRAGAPDEVADLIWTENILSGNIIIGCKTASFAQRRELTQREVDGLLSYERDLKLICKGHPSCDCEARRRGREGRKTEDGKSFHAFCVPGNARSEQTT